MKVTEFLSNYNRIEKELEAIQSKIICASIDNNIEEIKKQTDNFVKLRSLRWEIGRLNLEDIESIKEIFEEIKVSIYFNK